MEGPLIETGPGLERLAEQIRQLERRVQALEHRAAQPEIAAGSAPVNAPFPAAIETPPSHYSGLIQVSGKAVLGFGGAYLIRAAAESGLIPGLPGAATAVAYSAAWLAAAARTGRDRRAAGVVYAATSALTLLPMLWETTVRFRILPPWATAALLLAFAVSGSAVARFSERPGLMYATFVPAAAAAGVLIVATGELLPFAIVLLALCITAEAAASQNRWLGARPWIAAIAGLAVWLSLKVAAQPQVEAYRPVAWQAALALDFALLGAYAGSVIFRTVRRMQPVTPFEIAQSAVAYALVVSGVIRLTQATGVLGAGCLLFAAVSYYIGFRRFNPRIAPRNHTFYIYQGLTFVLAGIALLVSGWVAALLGSGISLAALFASRHTAPLTLTIQAAFCLAASALVSGLLEFAFGALTGVSVMGPPLSAGIVATAAVAAYFVCSGDRLVRWPRLAIAALAACATVALLIAGLAHLTSDSLSLAWLAALRTAAVSSAVLFLGLAGSRWKREELIWIGYAAAALLTLKLFWEDFRQESAGTLAVSLLSYGMILVLGPRLLRRAPKRE